MDFERYFGPQVAKRIEMPEPSETVEQWYDRHEEYVEDGRPFISILDSMDVLDSEDDLKHQKKRRSAKKKEQEGTGTYGTGKAKANSTRMRGLIRGIQKTNSIVIVICQTRESLGFGFDPKTRAGGKALKFYATLEIWSEVKQRLKKTIKGKPRNIGIVSRLRIKKNRVQGKERVIDIPIYYSTGFDDIGGCIDWLVEEGHWKKADKGGVTAPEFDFKGSREKLVRLIEDEDSFEDLRNIVVDVWEEIEQACIVERKSRYA